MYNIAKTVQTVYNNFVGCEWTRMQKCVAVSLHDADRGYLCRRQGMAIEKFSKERLG